MKLAKRFNWYLTILPILLFSLGFITLYSTAPDLASSQLIFFVISLFVYMAFSVIDYRLWAYASNTLYFIVLILLLATYLLGQQQFGSVRWLEFGQFSIQPSEFAKVVVVIVVSKYLSTFKSKEVTYKDIIKVIGLFAPVFILVFLQPDLGTAVVLLLTFVVMLWFGNVNKWYFLASAACVGIFSTPAWNLLKGYQKERILVFLNPALDILGAGYNVIQSTIAVGSGMLWGRGFGRGTQSHLQFLPVYWTDFVFAAFAEEWGFIGVVTMLVLFFALLMVFVRVLINTKSLFGVLVVSGALTIICVQLVINVGMNLGLMPVTGIPLPFVSYGGSSLLTTFALLGLIHSVWIHKKV